MRASKSNIALAFLTLIMIASWVGFEIYRTYKTSTVEPDVTQAITPLDPKVDMDTLTKIESRYQK